MRQSMDSVLSLFDRVDLKEESYVWVFDRIVVGSAYEYTGRVQHAGDEDFRNLGGQCLCAVYGAACLSGIVACHGQVFFYDAVEGGTEVHASGRRDRRGDHLYGDQGYGDAGAGQSGDDHRDLTADRGVSDRAFRAFWRGKAAAGDAQDRGNGRGDCRNCDF